MVFFIYNASLRQGKDFFSVIKEKLELFLFYRVSNLVSHIANRFWGYVRNFTAPNF